MLLARVIAGTAALLALLSAATYLYWGSGPVLVVIPWFNPLILTFQALIAMCVAFLALGRHQVLRDPMSYWIGLAFGLYGVALVFYVLTWPGLFPGDRSFLAELPNTAAWFAVTGAGALASFLLAAPVARWPGERNLAGGRWTWSVVGWLGGYALLSAVLVAGEHRLPELVTPTGRFTPLLIASDGTIALLFAAGAVLSVRQHLRTGDTLPAYGAFMQVAWVFTEVSNLIGAKRYDLWWYSQRVVLAAAALVTLFGVLSGYVVLYRREREKTRALEEAVRRRNEHLSMLSHELRNPLGAIASALGVAGQREPADPALRRAIEVGRRQVGHMARMLDGLLDVARITRGTIVLRPERLDARTAVERAVETVRPKIEARRHRLAVVLPREALPVDADPVRVSQVIANLLDNAAKYTPDGGQITVAARQEGREAIIRVRDTGRGIAPERLPHVFDAFERGELSMGDAEAGLGLGLALARRLVELSGGRIEAQSEGPGAGSEFAIRLLARTSRVARGSGAP